MWLGVFLGRAMKFLPTTIPDLLDQLEEQYPPRCLKPGEEVEAHIRYAGKVELIEHLRDLLNATEKKAMAANMKLRD